MLDLLTTIHQMIDLRSDTSTLPTPAMWEAMRQAPLGDGGRVDLTGRGEDPSVYRLEQLAADITGKADGAYFPTGSLANHTALLTATNRGDKVLVEKTAHVYISEKYDFTDKGSGLVPIFYHLNSDYQVDLAEIEYLLADGDIKVLCLENTHNYSSGTCLTPQNIDAVCRLAHARGVHVHLDGARIFNAAIALAVDVKVLAQHVDSMMFCVSKGLCAPVGSLLVGSQAFIDKTRATSKLLGTFMRQAGMIAAAGIVALNENIGRLQEDHENAVLLGRLISGNPNIIFDSKAVQTNMVYCDVTPTGLSAQAVTDMLKERGLLVAKMTDKHIRMVTSRDTSRAVVEQAAAIMNECFRSLAQPSR